MRAANVQGRVAVYLLLSIAGSVDASAQLARSGKEPAVSTADSTTRIRGCIATDDGE